MALIPLILLSESTAVSSTYIDIREAWNENRGELAKALRAGAGFSFSYTGKVVGPEIPGAWHHSVSKDARAGVTRTILNHESGLVVTREMRVFPDFGAVEYKLHFKNAGAKTIPPVSAIQNINLSFSQRIANGNCVISSGGGGFDGFLPPRDFAIRKTCFSPIDDPLNDGSMELTAEGGVSSGKNMPFFFLQNDALQEGAFVAFGWSGQWRAVVQRDSTAGGLRIKAGIPDLEIALEPGEESQGPTVLVGLYKGTLADGSNRLRRLIRDMYTPRLAGKTFLPVATYDNYWYGGDAFDESLLRKLADGAAAIGQEYFLLDAGWYQGEKWSTSVGNWEQVNSTRLPGGLKPVSNYIRSKGLKFGLWFEPERVARDSKLAKEHPGWILWDHGAESEDSINNVWGVSKDGVLDYGRPEVQQWVQNMLDHYIRDYGVKYIRYDFNIDPLPYWNAHDIPNRRGMTQLRHIQGFYAIIDWIRERHPDTILEGCASGGRRIDLETARRFHTFWISDSTVDPSIVRFHLFGINYFLPGNYHYIQYALPTPSQRDFQPDDLGLQGMFGGAFGTGGRVDLWTESMKQKALLHVGIWKKLRHYLVEDYYPLSDQPGDLKSWSGWQFQDAQDRSGFIQTFRTLTSEGTHRFFVRNLDGHAVYRFTDVYSNETFDVRGSVAMQSGIEITEAPMSSKVIAYAAIPVN